MLVEERCKKNRNNKTVKMNKAKEIYSISTCNIFIFVLTPPQIDLYPEENYTNRFRCSASFPCATYYVFWESSQSNGC